MKNKEKEVTDILKHMVDSLSDLHINAMKNGITSY